MNRLPSLLCAVLVAICVSFSCASKAGQLEADNIGPLVDVVTYDLEAYLDAGRAPDGSALSPTQIAAKRGGCVILRNAVATAQEREREPLPTFFEPGRVGASEISQPAAVGR